MNLVDLAETLGLESSDLDEAVHDCAQDGGLAVLNTLVGGAEQEEHITEVEADAASINNAGLEAQLEFLLTHNGDAEVRALLEELAKEKGEAVSPESLAATLPEVQDRVYKFADSFGRTAWPAGRTEQPGHEGPKILWLAKDCVVQGESVFEAPTLNLDLSIAGRVVTTSILLAKSP